MVIKITLSHSNRGKEVRVELRVKSLIQPFLKKLK